MPELVPRLFKVSCLQDTLLYPVVELPLHELEVVEEVDRQIKLQGQVCHNLEVLEVRDCHAVEDEVEAEGVLREYKQPGFHSSKPPKVPRVAEVDSMPTHGNLFQLEIKELERAKEMMVLQESGREVAERETDGQTLFFPRSFICMAGW
jgi:hypothetical protein